MPTETNQAVLVPIAERILVKQPEAPDVSKGGIFIPEGSKERPKEGNVIAIGDECKRVKVGDRVIFSAFTGNEYEFEGERFLIMREDEVLCVVR